MKNCFFFLYLAFQLLPVLSQEVQLVGVGFYNLENLFDTAHDPDTFDDDYTPTGTQHWNEALLSQKIENLSTVIRQIGGAENLPGLDLLGVCETENATVLRRLVRSERLRDLNYGFIHFDSPDHRGIAVALLYKLESFLPVHSTHYCLRLKSEKQFSITTRDQLVVTGYLWGEEVSVLVNHWPSRRGGKKRSAPLRKAAARLQQRIMDSLLSLNPKAEILMLGDFNDNPSDASLLRLTKKMTLIFILSRSTTLCNHWLKKAWEVSPIATNGIYSIKSSFHKLG